MTESVHRTGLKYTRVGVRRTEYLYTRTMFPNCDRECLTDVCGAESELHFSPEHLRDGKHEGVVEYDTQRPGQEVGAEFTRERPQQEEAGALLLLQLPQELGLVRQSASQGCSRGQGLLLPAADNTAASGTPQQDAGVGTPALRQTTTTTHIPDNHPSL